MLFNSFEFLFFYLPIVLGGFFFIAHHSHRMAALWLAAASIFFYGWWNPKFVSLLLASIVFNYCAGYLISKARATARSKGLLIGAVATNLSLLGVYKYANLFIVTIDGAGANIGLLDIVLPLGISFFTFTQIAFLVDVHRGIARENNFVHYLLFVTWFPHLIAGPVLHHKQMMPQFGYSKTYNPSWDNFRIGITYFTIGLAKKVLLADSLSEFATPVFNAAKDGQQIMLLSAWIGSLAYSFQLYFDFSGYSDMAIGLSIMFGVTLPFNFNSPYKSENIIEFWRRWHMTLSRFLMDYLYVPLGGNRKGKVRRHVNLMLTMLLGGLWHGANWTFVIWGGLHGLYLVANHTWRYFVPGLTGRLWKISSTAITFLAVLIAWVFFRSETFPAALSIVRGLFGLNGLSLPVSLSWMETNLTNLSGTFVRPVFTGITPELVTPISLPLVLFWIGVSSIIIWLTPNTQSIVASQDCKSPRGLKISALLLGCLFAMSVMSFSKVSEFLYFQF